MSRANIADLFEMQFDSHGPKEPSLDIPHGKGNFWGLSGPLESIGSQLLQHKNYSLVNNDMTCDAAFRRHYGGGTVFIIVCLFVCLLAG